jgi:hypothetical protein
MLWPRPERAYFTEVDWRYLVGRRDAIGLAFVCGSCLSNWQKNESVSIERE